MAKKQFKAESKRLLDLMVNSIYTHKEIFLREIISNASDAIDKLCYRSLTDDSVGLTRDDFKITVQADKEKRTLTVSDNGIGMTAKELEDNLGVIASSGSFRFKSENEPSEDIDIIGQFGVGFYSAFMVAKRVTVISRAFGEEDANEWVSEGADGYKIAPCSRDAAGTDVIIELKDDTPEENYSLYLEEYTLHELIKKYSDYVRWPIMMEVTRSRLVETGEVDEKGAKKKDWEDYKETETVNSRVPIWQRPKSEVSDEDCENFYREKFMDPEAPAAVIRIAAEGTVSFKALLFIPSVAPYGYYSRDYKAGLQLYSSGVMIMEHCDEILPEYFRFVRGVVDSPDLSLNISRELLQHDRQLKVISQNIEKKVRAELLRLQEHEPEKYEKFYAAFSPQLKYGILNAYGSKNESLRDLLMFYSANVEKNITLKKYADAMPDAQKYIYAVCGKSVEDLKALPQAEPVLAKGYDILFLTNEMDETLIRMLGSYADKQFRLVDSDDLELESAEEKAETERKEAENREVLDFVKESLGGAVAAVRLSHKLVSRPVCLTTQGPVTFEMEKYFAAMPDGVGQKPKAERVLELNADHPIFAALRDAYSSDKDKAKKYAELLYGQAQLIAGLQLQDTARFSELICELMV
ncbi:MAG: molecular chaperone HtpG [Oscillospiraceae bacterium]|nr:molecular chaperone HtpG [Oscillospiraceae bacterium]